MQLWEEMALAKQEAKTEGESSKLIEQICKKLRKGLSPEQIAEDLEEDLNIVQDIYEVALAFAPDYDKEKVFSEWKQKDENS